MKIRNIVLSTMIASTVLAGGVLVAQQGEPVHNVNRGHHPNLSEAQRLSQEAFNKISAAQEANEWDMEGHAAKAKDLLEQVNRELKQAAEASNKNHK